MSLKIKVRTLSAGCAAIAGRRGEHTVIVISPHLWHGSIEARASALARLFEGLERFDGCPVRLPSQRQAS